MVLNESKLSATFTLVITIVCSASGQYHVTHDVFEAKEKPQNS